MHSEDSSYRRSLQRAEEALDSGCQASVVNAFKFFAAAVIAASAVGGAMSLLSAFTWASFWSLSVLSLVMLPCSFVMLEWMRLQEHSRIMRALHDEQVSYEALLAEARKERDEFELRARRLQHERELIMMSSVAVRALEAASQLPDPDLPPGEAPRRPAQQKE